MMKQPNLAIVFTLINLIIFPAEILAQSQRIEIRFIPRTANQTSTSGETRGNPPTKPGPGSRGDCISKTTQMTLLVGDRNLESTISDRPTFWVYVPYTPAEATSGEFSLQQGGTDLYRTPFTLPATPGIVSVTLPPSVKPLEFGKKYRWYFNINCPQLESSRQKRTPAFVTGRVEKVRLSSEVENELRLAKTTLEKIAILARNGIWYDTLTELAQLRLQEPGNRDALDAWNTLLKSDSIRLGGIAQERIIGNITTNSQ